MSLLEKYPPGLLAGLQSTSHGAIEDLLVAFPDQQQISTQNLHDFVQAYQVPRTLGSLKIQTLRL